MELLRGRLYNWEKNIFMLNLSAILVRFVPTECFSYFYIGHKIASYEV
ncbi:hypothetical protein Mucpa_6010 [Mucilaginibacter paludis DSM 18603]|uniref:Uncharacterized protein n=1 Tax=Mucilaginibacter paludis DSM 18603 TaxID=714943 RepID=H1YB36_9SPHI|nr:hypothetical protein Mucpa_6010 [Mucilaginibacter paludis DSM 18603]